MARSNETEESPPPRRRFTDQSRSFESVLGSQVAIRGEVQGTTNMDFAAGRGARHHKHGLRRLP
jgi:hypothetical protein